jgi:hypothetical protein
LPTPLVSLHSRSAIRIIQGVVIYTDENKEAQFGKSATVGTKTNFSLNISKEI